MILLADSEGPDQAARMRSLIWAFAVRICPKTSFRMARPIFSNQRERNASRRLCDIYIVTDQPVYPHSTVTCRFSLFRIHNLWAGNTYTQRTYLRSDCLNIQEIRYILLHTAVIQCIRIDRPEKKLLTQIRRRNMWRLIKVCTVFHFSTAFL